MTSQDYIYRNAIIDKGPPVHYQLRLNMTEMKVEGEGQDENKEGGWGGCPLRKCTLGEKDPKKPNRTILLVGGTGSGKSAFINSLVNYAMGIKKEDNEWFEIVPKEGSKSQSATLEVTVYEIFGFEDKMLPFSLTIIDTPGFGDTREIERDPEITRALHDLFSQNDGIHEIHAVGLVLKAAENRLSDRLLYIFDSVMSLFGKNLEEKIVALITHSDGMPPKNALQALTDTNITCARSEGGQPIHFVFNNCLETNRTEETELGLDQAWQVTIRGMKKFAAFLEKSEPQKLEEAVEVMYKRISLTACVNNLKDRIQLRKLQEKEIEQTKEGLEKHKEEMRTGKNFTIVVDEPYKEKEDIEGGMWFFMFSGAVCCNICEENCHYPGCTLAWYPSHCKVMKKGNCTVCTNKCPASKHVKENKKYVIKTRKVKKTQQELKEAYESDQTEIVTLLSKLQNKKENLEKERFDLLDEAFLHLVILDQIALNANSVSTFIHLDFLINQMKETKDEEKIQKLEEMKKRMDKSTEQSLRYRFAQMGNKIKDGFFNLMK